MGVRVRLVDQVERQNKEKLDKQVYLARMADRTYAVRQIFVYGLVGICTLALIVVLSSGMMQEVSVNATTTTWHWYLPAVVKGASF